jgi:DnaJ family protein C protein 13
MLIETIKRETEDENLFSSSVGILEAACELCYYTLKCSPLNAEELRREGGLQVPPLCRFCLLVMLFRYCS